jgi:threonyl-tRNA synthetase
MIKISFPDGSVREYENGITGMQIAESISPALARNCVACGINGETTELNRPVNEERRPDCRCADIQEDSRKAAF